MITYRRPQPGVFPYGSGIYHGEILLGRVRREGGGFAAETAGGRPLGAFDAKRSAISAVLMAARRRGRAEAMR